MTQRRLQSAHWHLIRVSEKTCWIFVQLQQDDGTTGWGEASWPGHEAAVLAAADALGSRILEAPTNPPGAFAAGIALTDIAQAAVVSAVDQALWDLHARAQQSTAAQALGGIRRHSIPTYANINRRTEPRTPQGFAQSAKDALAAGHVAFKLAPFDEVSTAVCAAGGGEAAMQMGLARIAAVREVIGPQRRLMVDCHWRFDEPSAAAMMRAAAEMGVYWIECPLPEIAGNMDALVRLRALANPRGMRMAGLELGIRFDAFRPYCEAGAYDVMMPDIKYIGGMQEMLHTADQLAHYGVQFSPHNPNGPISHAASLQIAAAVESLDMLEMQFDETPLFDQLTPHGFEPASNGHCQLPTELGLGTQLLDEVLSRHAIETRQHHAASD